MTIDQVRDAYTARATEYIDVVGSIEHADSRDVAYIDAWANAIDGPILDVGCGPGQWTSHLHERGAAVEGIDPVAVFIEGARTRYPESRYRVGRAEDLQVEKASVGGILAWYSLIHTAPDMIGRPLEEFARCLRPGGSLVIGFVDGPAGVAFDHSVITAYSWSVQALTDLLDTAGFTVVDSATRSDPGQRPQGRVTARRHPESVPG
ncbi:class I SAM-dependent methyltransferase [Naasia lichenicola]|uniref:Class I SAM-dependent methyltransferase n=1 Tax=Naasia lichenicola TaxID=2565933 RepID=A0A4S4FU68_9MICO|nr:class I SAM-dependent methyltransferase [Naasia lichenicola]THG33542.1 class I SAM-dependent methyltransferase [Naasia lichenicola]